MSALERDCPLCMRVNATPHVTHVPPPPNPDHELIPKYKRDPSTGPDILAIIIATAVIVFLLMVLFSS